MAYLQRSVVLGFMLVAALGCPSQLLAFGQTQEVRVDVSTNVTGATVYVDGVRVTTPSVFQWAVGSKHKVAADLVQENRGLRAKYRFLQWSTSNALANPEADTIEIVAGGSNMNITALFATEYLLSLNVYTCSQTMPYCQSPGTAFLNGTPYNARAELYMPAGTVVSLRAHANDDHVFSHWNLVPGGVKQTQSITLTLDQGIIATPEFKSAATVPISILTEPPGLKVMVDGAELSTPTTVKWAWFSEHTIATAPAQQDPKGNWWVFDNWSDAGAPSHVFTVRGGAVPDSLVARFVHGTRVEIGSNPPGLMLTVDNRECRECVHVWRIGDRHVISTSREQNDQEGLSFRFRDWDNGDAVPLVFTTPKVPEWNRVRISGRFDPLGVIKVDSRPQGIPIKVGEIDCSTPCKVQKRLGTPVSLAAPANFNNTHQTRLEFVGWADWESRSRSITAAASPQEVTANYRMMSRLSLSADPPNAATFDVVPSSPDGYYEGNARVSVTAVPRPGYRFHSWDGDLSGTVLTGSVSMGGPRSALARFEQIPYINENGVRNAATEIHGGEVAPCSVVSISGRHLSSGIEGSSSRPLPQSIAGVNVLVEDRMVPLYFVSPDQINAQLPCDLPEGIRSVTVRPGPAVEATTAVRVTRNSPGLFTQSNGDQIYAAATRDDGTTITAKHPAKPAEYVTLYGTGFGPLRWTLPEGFAPSGWSGFETLDAVEVISGDTSLAPVTAGAAPNQPGVNYVRFKLGDSLPPSGIKVRVNGRDSNIVELPVER